MKQYSKVKGFLTVMLSLVLWAAVSVQASAGSAEAGASNQDFSTASVQKEKNVQNPVTLEIIGLTDGKLKSGDKVTFRASGGMKGEYYLVMSVDGNPVGARIMQDGELTLTSGSMANRYEDYVLPIGLEYTVYAFRAERFSTEREYSAEQQFSVAYKQPAEYTLKAKGAARLYTGGSLFSLQEPPILYKNGQPYKTTAEMESVLRFKIYTEQERTLVSQDGMIEDVGYYEVTVYELFKDDETGEFFEAEAEPVKAKILPREVRVDQGLLDGGKFTVSADYDGRSHGIDASKVSVDGMSKDQYTISYRYLSETNNKWEESKTAPAYVNPGTYTVYITANFSTSKLLTSSAVANIVIGKNEIKQTDDGTDAVTYTIQYQLNGGANNKDNPSTYSTADVTLNNPTRKGYSFAGWFTDKNFKDKITKITAAEQKDLILYAKWKKVTVGKVSVKSLKYTGGKKAALKIKKVNGASGYEILYGTSKSLKKGSKTTTTKQTKVTLKKLKKNKAYYVKVRAYKIDSTNSKVYGKYSGTHKVKIRK